MMTDMQIKIKIQFYLLCPFLDNIKSTCTSIYPSDRAELGVKKGLLFQVNEILNAVVVRIFDEAVKKAEEVDREIANMNDKQLAEYAKSRPLLGVPFTVKDTVKVEGQIITCGVYSQRDKRCTRSAEVIKR
ncbi:unnamed protein product [Cylicostephanus goldi]|uniref:Amidase domain-containing protein n=1 Tax=Cylicostephanus goldi TaxID=71465 RepID=A0A3P6UIL1_CYLGO|nr:unnamed protein product [Cylicostephanus goldi]